MFCANSVNSFYNVSVACFKWFDDRQMTGHCTLVLYKKESEVELSEFTSIVENTELEYLCFLFTDVIQLL